MDLMEIRRNMMGILAMAGGSGMVGNFSQYYKTTATFPNAQNSTAWGSDVSVACSFEPKVVIVTGGDETVNGNVLYGIFIFDNDNNGNHLNAGVITCTNASGVLARTAYYGVDVGTQGNKNGGTATFRYYEGVFQTQKLNNVSRWSTTDTYTFEFYG